MTPDEERVYRLVVGAFRAEPADIAERLGSGVDEVLQTLQSLHTKGLITRVAPNEQRYVPTPPDVAFGPLLLRGQESLEWARNAVAELVEEYRGSARRRDPSQLVEVVTGAAAIRQQVVQLQLNATYETRWFCRAGHVAMPASENTEQFAAQARGVRYRVIYERDLLEEPGMIENVAAGVRHGEIARAAATLPVRLGIADDSIALCPLVSHADGATEPTAALVRESNLLTALIALFESYWDQATPLQVDQPDQVEADERYLLSLLVSGVTDKAIATQLQVSQRTVQRRISDVMRRVNAHTRMQLAWEVSQRGWLDTEAPAPTTLWGPGPNGAVASG
nr:Transcriptional regulator, TrmB family / Transcriptional regulator, LuxR family [Kibdelosporangium sp. MJ126-NF4]CTQ88923.1 Transcriptional regulator, TrmB family / Transcriptional regulator, LuxR family [Kibdelosporangium sp. MJ126-NF4]